MSAIYTPRGRALEYSELALNLYKGCAHACEYCFAPSATFVERQRFSSPEYISPRPGILDQVEKEAQKLRGDTRPILISFTSDCYQPIEKTKKLTRLALHILADNRLRPQILTKAGLWAIERDIDLLLQTSGIWAATLTADDDAESLRWEPGAALPGDRIAALRFAHEAGLETWVSFEPVINPEAVYRIIRATASFVDFYKVGKLNYHPHAKTIDWLSFREKVIICLEEHQKSFYLKKDLRDL